MTEALARQHADNAYAPPRADPTALMDVPHHFEVATSRHGDALILAPRGELDLATTPQVRDLLDGRDGDVRLLVVDLRAVEFLDSTGMHLLIDQHRCCADDGCSFAVVRGPAVERFIALAGLDKLLPLVDSPEDAIAQLP
jgi:anti-sigma B factor antagonist